MILTSNIHKSVPLFNIFPKSKLRFNYPDFVYKDFLTYMVSKGSLTMSSYGYKEYSFFIKRQSSVFFFLEWILVSCGNFVLNKIRLIFVDGSVININIRYQGKETFTFTMEPVMKIVTKNYFIYTTVLTYQLIGRI